MGGNPGAVRVYRLSAGRPRPGTVSLCGRQDPELAARDEVHAAAPLGEGPRGRAVRPGPDVRGQAGPCRGPVAQPRLRATNAVARLERDAVADRCERRGRRAFWSGPDVED